MSIKTKCENCGVMIITNEEDYAPGTEQAVACPRCNTHSTVLIPSKGTSNREVITRQGEVPSVQNSQQPDDLRHREAEIMLKAKDLELKERELQLREKEYNSSQNQPVNNQQTVVEHHYHYSNDPVPVSSKSKTTAGLLAIFLGALGAHKFYLGKTGMGILYLVFCWTYIPGILGLIEGIVYLTKTDADFHRDHVAK